VIDATRRSRGAAAVALTGPFPRRHGPIDRPADRRRVPAAFIDW